MTTLRLRVYDAAVFSNYLSLKRRLDSIPTTITKLVLDLEATRLVDHTPSASHELAARRKPVVSVSPSTT